VAVAAVGLAAWFGWAAFGPDGGDGKQRDFTFRNVALTLPPFRTPLWVHQYSAAADSPDKPGGGPLVRVFDMSEARSGQMVIDAITREVLSDTISGDMRDEADELRDSIRAPTGDDAVWPLADIEPPAGSETRFGGIAYVEPDERSGISIILEQGDGMGESGTAVSFHNGRSYMFASLETNGTTIEFGMKQVLPDDQAAFERLATNIRFEPIDEKEKARLR
jgi:hypothetical protein